MLCHNLLQPSDLNSGGTEITLIWPNQLMQSLILLYQQSNLHSCMMRHIPNIVRVPLNGFCEISNSQLEYVNLLLIVVYGQYILVDLLEVGVDGLLVLGNLLLIVEE